jgi:hypothetical protein
VTAAALLAEARAAEVTLRLVDGKPKVAGQPSPELLGRLRAAKAELVDLLSGTCCRHCGAAIDWRHPSCIAFQDGMGAHLRCYEDAEIARLHAAAERALAGVVATSDEGELLRAGDEP